MAGRVLARSHRAGRCNTARRWSPPPPRLPGRRSAPIRGHCPACSPPSLCTNIRGTRHEEARSRCSHRRRRTDRLQHPFPHRRRRNAGARPARDPADAGIAHRQGAGRAEGRDDGDRGLRVSAGRRHGRRRRPRDRIQGRRRRCADRREAARPGDGAQGSADGEREDLHRAGQGSRQGRESRRQGAGRRQSGQHQRLHRNEVGALATEEEFYCDAAARPQPRAVAIGHQVGTTRGVDREAHRLGQPFADDVRRLSLCDCQRRVAEGTDQRRGVEPQRVPADRRQARRRDHRRARALLRRVGRERGDRSRPRLDAGQRRQVGDDGRSVRRQLRHPPGRDVRRPGHHCRRRVHPSVPTSRSTRSRARRWTRR